MTISRNYILYFALLMVAILLSPIDEYIRNNLCHGKTITNYIIVFIVFANSLLFKNIPVNKKAFKIIGSIFFIFLINFVFAPFRNLSWFLYQILFLMTALYIASIYSRINIATYTALSARFKKICNLFVIFITCASIYLLIRSFSIFIDIFRGLDSFRNYVWQLYGYLSWDKNRLGGALAFMICYAFVQPKRKIWAYLFFLPVLPLIASVRHLLFGLTLALIFITVKKTRYLILMAAILFILVFIAKDNIFKMLKNDTRINCFINTGDIITHCPFGVGHGAYFTYVRNVVMKTSKYNVFFTLTGNKIMPEATESDIVYVFGSLGLIWGIMLYGILIRLAFKLRKLYSSLTFPDKFFALIFIYYLFAGFAEDQMFCFSYWLIFGFALGVLTAKRNQFAEITGQFKKELYARY